MDAKPELRHLCHLPLGDWYAVGLKLGIKDRDLEAAEKEHWGKTKDQIREMFGLWLQRDTEATYRKLIEVLLRRKETESADTLVKEIGVSYQGPPPSTRGPAIGLDNKPELAVIIDVPAALWHIIGLELGLPENKLQLIELDRKGDTNAMKREMLRTWLRQDGKASYRQLAKALMASDLNGDAKSLVESIGHTLEEIEQSTPLIPPEGCTMEVMNHPIPPQVTAPLAPVRPQVVEVPSGVCTLVAEVVDGADHCLVSSDIGPQVPAYKMKSSHGIALIVSNIEFVNGRDFHKRDGGDVDERNLQDLFSPKYLNYKVVLLKDLTGEQIDLALRLVSGHEGLTYAKVHGNDREALKALSNGDNLISADHDSFICCLLSHGTEGVVNGTDGKEFDLKNIYNYLGPCKHLSGKPKMAFIQACQGEKIAIVPPASVQSDGAASVQSDGITTEICDFLKSFAAFYGQLSFRAADGTWYINALCKIFKENYKKMDVVSMITDVHKEVTKEIGEMKEKPQVKCQQCPLLVLTLRHKVHFAVKGGWGLW